MDLWTSPTDRREPCGPCGQPVDNADALPTACPHSRASRPQAPQDQPPVILTRQHRTTLRRGCLHRPFRTTSASHSNPSQHRPRPGSPPILQAHFRMGLDLLRLPRSRRRDFLQTIVWRYSLFLTNPRERRRNRADTNGRNTPEGLPVRTGPSACWAAADGARGAGRIRLPGGPDRAPAPERLAADVLLPYLRVRGRSSHDDLDFADLVVERDADPAAHADDHRLAGVESRGQPVIKADAGRIQVWRLWAG